MNMFAVLIFSVLAASFLLVIGSLFGKSWKFTLEIGWWRLKSCTQKKDREADKYQAVSAQDILHKLNESQLLPFCHKRGWTLRGYHGNAQTWRRRRRHDVISGGDLVGCCTTLPVNARVCLDHLRHLTYLRDWDLSIISSAYLQQSPPTDTPRPDWDIVRLTSYRAWLVDLGAWFLWLREAWFVKWVCERWFTYSAVYQRYWYQEEDGSCWLLRTCVDRPDWSFYFAQPSPDGHQCTLSLVHCDSLAGSTPSISAQLNSFRTYIHIQSISYQSLHKLSLPRPDPQPTVQDPIVQDPIVQNSIVQNSIARDSVIETHAVLENGSVRYRNTDQYSERRSSSVLESGPLVQKLSRASTIAEYDVSREQKLSEWVDSTALTHNYSTQSLGLTCDTQYRVCSNQCAGQIITELTYASNLDLSLKSDEQARSTCGWIFSHSDKDILILKKHAKQNSSGIFSYIGKGMIEATPRAVWDAVRNPRTRFTYDETLKKMEILHDFGSELKVVHMYHEVNNVFKRECRDFCVLYGEKTDGDRYILTMSSVDWLPCPVKHDVIRGQFLSSGWVIEPTFQNGRLQTMVTYLSQMNLKTTGSHFVDEIASRQPLAVGQLRQLFIPRVKRRGSRTPSVAPSIMATTVKDSESGRSSS